MDSRGRAVASITSKFETVLHEGGHERDAFWSRTHRFQYAENEMPGPGTYGPPRSAESVAPSFSKKGYTGMASKSKRFGIGLRTQGPAPGTYDALGCFKAVKDRRDFSVGITSGAFATPIVAQGAAAHRKGFTIAPGPGQYEIPGLAAAIMKQTMNKGKRAPFLYGSERKGAFPTVDPDDETSGGPAPWTYDPEAINRQTGAFKLLTSKAPSSAFCSKTTRLLQTAGVDKIVEMLKPHPSLGPSLGIHVDIRGSGISKPRSAPGPGQYDPYARDHAITLDYVRHSSVFADTQNDRFGIPTVPKATHIDVPGPGSYHVPSKLNLVQFKAEATSSAFLSTADRSQGGAVPRRVAPGPAYYNPPTPKHKSFHYNTSGRWA